MLKQNIFRTMAITLGLSLSLVGVTSANAATMSTSQTTGIVKTSPYSDPFAKRVFDLINVERAKVKAPALKWNQTISDVSQDWSNKLEVATKNPKWDFGTIHRPDAGRSLLPAGFSWYGEIIGFNFSPEGIVQWWMGSPGHKEAMLRSTATDIGIGYTKPTTGPYAGWTLVTSNLATYPKSTVTPPVSPPKPVTPPVAPTPVVPDKRLNVIDGSGNLWGYNEPGKATLTTRNLLGTGWSNVKQLMTVDWNNDGQLDLVAKWPSGQITMYAGIGNGDYKMPIVIGTGWQNLDITIAKLRKTDTYPGIVARGITDGKLYYYPNNKGNMNLGKITLGTGGWQYMSELNAVDWDKDGNMDIIARNQSGELRLYRGNGNGAFVNETRRLIGTGWGIMTSITMEPNLYGAGTAGLIAKSSTGILYYYPMIKNGFGARVTLGLSGWTKYLISEGSP